MEIKGQKILKVCSILMIVFGSLGLLAMIVSIAGLSAIGGIAAGFGGAATAMGIALLAFFVGICIGAIELTAGIIGVKACKKPTINGIKTAFILGIILIAFDAVAIILNIVNDTFSFGSIASLAIPVVYFLGVLQYRAAIIELASGK